VHSNFCDFFNSWFDTLYEIRENWYTANNNEFTLYVEI
jgi:hypothetical protein